MTKKVESNTWGESVPRTCDWRKAKNIISSVKNQVSVLSPPSLAQSTPRSGEMRPRPYPIPPSPFREAANAAGPWQLPTTSRLCGASNTSSLWTSLCRV